MSHTPLLAWWAQLGMCVASNASVENSAVIRIVEVEWWVWSSWRTSRVRQLRSHKSNQRHENENLHHLAQIESKSDTEKFSARCKTFYRTPSKLSQAFSYLQ
jgi:hypothetical protein